MNKCSGCGTLYPEHYDKCPRCQRIESSKHQRVIKTYTKQDETVNKTLTDDFVTHSEVGIFYTSE